MPDSPTVTSIMTKTVLFVHPKTLLVDATEILTKNNLSGLPVVDENKKLLGILTEYDLVTKGAKIHLPTFIKLLNEFSMHKKDRSLIRDDLAEIVTITVGDVMNNDPLVLEEHATLEEATLAFAEHHRVNPIPIVDAHYRLVGILSRFDIIKFYSPFAPQEASHLRHERNLDKKMNAFLNAFERRFIFVSKFRSKYWFLLSIVFVVVGFFIAIFLLGRIVINY